MTTVENVEVLHTTMSRFIYVGLFHFQLADNVQTACGLYFHYLYVFIVVLGEKSSNIQRSEIIEMLKVLLNPSPYYVNVAIYLFAVSVKRLL